MISKEQIEKILRLNGVKPTSPDEEIKSVLIRARWHKDDVETAIDILRENIVTHEKKLSSGNALFTSDERLEPATISSLLGITLDISEESIAEHSRASKQRVTVGLLVQIAVVGLVIAFALAVTTMWFLEMGLFHQSGAFYSTR